MPHDLRDTLERSFGHSGFRAGQEQVIQTLLAGRSALALFPTGAGKSLCYQLPGLLMDGVTVVISPLIALMKDQVGSLESRGIPAARLDSSLSATEVASVYDGIRSGSLKLLYIAPERLLNEQFIARLASVKIAMMAVDEAHCISEWGHNFRPEYLRLAHVAKELGIRPVLALTATATPAVAADICRAFDIAAQDHVQNSFRRPNLSYRITPCTAEERLGILTNRLLERQESAIVYVTLQKTAEEVAGHLRKNGHNALAYHAGLPDEQRHEAQEAFMAGRADTIVATIAFGMGIDKADIRAVYHYNLPKTLENYAQETGRAGRDGRPAVCELLACGDDRIVLDNFTYGDTPSAEGIRHLLDELLSAGARAAASKGGEFDVSVYELAQATDIRPLVIETVLTHLELAGVLRPLGSFYASYQFRLLEPEAVVLAGHTPERQAFLKRLLHAGRRGTKWSTLQPDEAAAEMHEPRDRILKALTWLADSGRIELKPSGSRQRYRLAADPATRESERLSRSLQELFAVREARDLERLQEVFDFASHRGCLTRRLLGYFGETLGDEAGCGCGTCTSCEEAAQSTLEAGGGSPRNIPTSVVPPISPAEAAIIRGLIGEGRASLRTPRQLARFLCGLTSPATTRERLGRHAAFGLLARLPFVNALAEAQTFLNTGRS